MARGFYKTDSTAELIPGRVARIQPMKETSEANTDSKTNESERISYLNIAFSTKGVAEYSGKRCVVFIPREQIVRIESRVGFRAERPLVQGIAGILLGGLGAYGIFMMMRAGWALARWEAGFIVFGGMGVWLFYEALRCGYYLVVTGPKETRKIVFDGKVEESQLREFLSNAAQLGYDCRFGSQ
jgi:hypothetical protein